MPNDDIPAGLAPLGGGSPAAPQKQPVPAAVPVAPTAPVPPVAAPRNPAVPPSRFDAPATGAASRFDAPASPATPRPPTRPDSGDEDGLPAGRIAGSLVAGLVVGAICLAGWLRFVQAVHFNLSFIAVGVGFAIGFVVSAVAQKDNPFTVSRSRASWRWFFGGGGVVKFRKWQYR